MKKLKIKHILTSKKKLSPSLRKKISRVKLMAIDVDGVLTDSRILWIEGSGWTRSFSVHDGHGIKMLIKAGYDVAVISGGDSKAVRLRAEFLGIKHIYLGNEDKIEPFKDLLQKTGLKADQIAYIGDDVFDVPVLEKVGFSATVPGAIEEVKPYVDYITEKEGGFGAVREFADLIRKYGALTE